jgi:hypothetical protein
MASPKVENLVSEGLFGVRFGVRLEAPPESDGIEIIDEQTCGTMFGFPLDDFAGGSYQWFDYGCRSTEIFPVLYYTVAVRGPGSVLLGDFYDRRSEYRQPITVVDCASREWGVLNAGQAGWVSVGGAAVGLDTDGCNPLLEPCNPQPVPVGQRMTWGRLKAKYGPVPAAAPEVRN